MIAQMLAVDERVTTYTTATDYSKIFAEEMHSLYLLAFMLTANEDKAEECFVGALGECIDRSSMFMEWARSWGRRMIVKHAVRMIRPTPEEGANGLFISIKSAKTPGSGDPSAAVVSLSAFERFVFVMSVLEGQSDEDCQSLLGRSQQELLMAREVALRFIAAANPGWEHAQAKEYTGPELLN